MKKKSLKLRSSYFFRQRIHGKHSADNMLELVKPESEGEKTESIVRDILRWADDGGKMLDFGSRAAGSEPDITRNQGLKIARGLSSEDQFDNNGS